MDASRGAIATAALFAMTMCLVAQTDGKELGHSPQPDPRCNVLAGTSYIRVIHNELHGTRRDGDDLVQPGDREPWQSSEYCSVEMLLAHTWTTVNYGSTTVHCCLLCALAAKANECPGGSQGACMEPDDMQSCREDKAQIEQDCLCTLSCDAWECEEV